MSRLLGEKPTFKCKYIGSRETAFPHLYNTHGIATPNKYDYGMRAYINYYYKPTRDTFSPGNSYLLNAEELKIEREE